MKGWKWLPERVKFILDGPKLSIVLFHKIIIIAIHRYQFIVYTKLKGDLEGGMPQISFERLAVEDNASRIAKVDTAFQLERVLQHGNIKQSKRNQTSPIILFIR